MLKSHLKNAASRQILGISKWGRDWRERKKKKRCRRVYITLIVYWCCIECAYSGCKSSSNSSDRTSTTSKATGTSSSSELAGVPTIDCGPYYSLHKRQRWGAAGRQAGRPTGQRKMLPPLLLGRRKGRLGKATGLVGRRWTLSTGFAKKAQAFSLLGRYTK